jgi:hypothetical protein
VVSVADKNHPAGKARNGGADNYGTIFEMKTNGVLAWSVSFNNTNGANPNSPSL